MQSNPQAIPQVKLARRMAVVAMAIVLFALFVFIVISIGLVVVYAHDLL
jgi:hypothetical protein